MKNKSHINRDLSEALELPKEVLLNLPVLTILGTSDILIENHLGIISLENNEILLKTREFNIRIKGNNLQLNELSREGVKVLGSIDGVEFIKER